MPLLSRSSVAPPNDEDRLAVAVLVLQEFQNPAVCRECLRRSRCRSEERRRRKAQTASLQRSCRLASRRRSPSRRRASSRRAEARRHRSANAARTASMLAPSTPSATRIATRRPRMPPSPGRAMSDRAGDFFTSGFTSVFEHFRHRRRQRLHSETVSHLSCEVLIDVHQARDHPLTNGRRLDAREFEAKRVDDVFLLRLGLAVQKEPSLRVVLRELLRLPAHLVRVIGERLRERLESLRRPLETDSHRRANSARSSPGRDESPADACHRAGCCAPARLAS